MRLALLRPSWPLLPLCLLAAATGCERPNAAPSFANVSGKVLLRGQPLPGGRITFVSQGGFAGSATIRDDGTYKISAPTGDVQIAVDNSMLRRAGGTPMQPPQSEEMKKHSGGGEDPITGRYVIIPDKYTDPSKSGLSLKVKPGDNTYDVPLN